MPTTQYLQNEALEFLRNHFPVSLHLLLFGTCKARPFGNKMLPVYTVDEKRKTAYSCCWLEQSSRGSYLLVYLLGVHSHIKHLCLT